MSLSLSLSLSSKWHHKDITAKNRSPIVFVVNGFSTPATTISNHHLVIRLQCRSNAHPSSLNQQQQQHHQPLFNTKSSDDTSTFSTRATTTIVNVTTDDDDDDDDEEIDSSSSQLMEMRTTFFPVAARTLEEKAAATSDIDKDDTFLMNPMASFDLEEDDTSNNDSDNNDNEYRKGLITVGFITFLFSTNSPVLHGAFSGENPPPVLLVNAAVSVVALVGLLLGGDTLEQTSASSSASAIPDTDTGTGTDTCTAVATATVTVTSNDYESSEPKTTISKQPTQLQTAYGGLELGIWKFLGTTSNLYGLAYTTAGHGALLIQLTTLIVPIARGLLYKESISTRLKISIALAVSGVICFATDRTGTPSLLGDGLCVVAAICYSAYDLRLYEYGKVVDAKPLITTKIATQAILSILLFVLTPVLFASSSSTTAAGSWQETYNYLQTFVIEDGGGSSSSSSLSLSCIPIVGAVLWSGVAVNAVAPFLQVSGQQIIGPTKCQTIYASQPLWAAGLSFVFLGETLGVSGLVGGTAFLVALTLAATATTTTESESESESETKTTINE